MRIVGGLYRHRIIVHPDDEQHTRPTKDRVREAIFSAVGDISGYLALDLYAGSGAMGLEAISRGVSFAAFVDVSSSAIKAIKNNITNLKIPKQQFEVVKDNDINALKIFKNKQLRFDIIFLDPPYDKGNYQNIVDQLVENELMSEHAIIVIEANRPITLENFACQKVKAYRYGPVLVYIYWRKL